jgi:tRNA pseudouridine38-40 synthase
VTTFRERERLPETVRWRLDIAYDGGGFAGWAAQPAQRTVQGELERRIAQVLRLDHPVALVCAGRTDAGVHARGQVAHTDLPFGAVDDGGAALLHRLARVLPGDLVVRAVTAAPAGFDARFSAVWRRYCYRLWDSPIPPDPLRRHEVVAVRRPLDLGRMNAAASQVLGLRNFAAFCRRREGATTVRTLLELAATRTSDGALTGSVELTVRADAFCHSMVRALAGGLVAVGSGRRDPGWLGEIAAAAVRDPALEVMPARGLVLVEVGYPADEELATRADRTRSVRELR